MSDELPVQAGSAGLVNRAKAILMQPKAEWQRIAAETTEPMKVVTTYVLPLALIGPIAGFIGSQLFGYGAFGISYKPSIGTALTIAVMTFVFTFVSLFIIAFVANLLSPKFGGKDSFPAAFRLVAYAFTAAWVGAAFQIVPALSIIGVLFGLYSLYLFYLGSAPVMGVPEDKSVVYTLVTVVVAIVVNLVVNAIAGAITGSMIASAVTADDVGTINLGALGSVTAQGENSTVDLGELGRVEINGDTATLTVDGQEVEMDMAEVQAAAEAAAAEAEARTAE